MLVAVALIGAVAQIFRLRECLGQEHAQAEPGQEGEGSIPFCLSLDAKLPFLFILTAKPCLFNGFAAIYCRFALCCKALSDSAGGSI